jgi:hypothetical protein
VARGDNLRGRKHPESGRKKGVPNRLTSSFREAVLTVFRDIGGTEHLEQWALAHPTEFYKIAARLIPNEITGQVGVAPSLVIRYEDSKGDRIDQ